MNTPILNYLGHTIAHPQWAHKPPPDYLDHMSSDLAQYAHTPLDGWERKHVVKSILRPRWLDRARLMPSDEQYHEVDKFCAAFL